MFTDKAVTLAIRKVKKSCDVSWYSTYHIYALSGCHTVVCCWGIGKGKVVKVQKAGHTLPSIGIVSASQAELAQEATPFMAAFYE